MVQVRVNGKCDAYALLDSGSTGTFITERLARSLQLDGTQVSYKMNTLGSSSEITSKVVSFNMAAPEGESVSMEQVLVVDDIPARLPEMKIDLQRYPHLTGLPLLELKDGVRADILIGMDKAHILMPLEVRSNPDAPDQPYAVRTLFGWSVSGTVQGGGASEVMSHFVSLEEQVERLWQLETHDDDVRLGSCQDHQVVNLWNNEIRIVDGHYELPIPWKDERPCMPYNRHMAVHRLRNLTTKLNKNGMMDKYSENLVKMLDSGYAEPVPTEELSLRDGQVWYLPHHAVLHVAKPGKVRLVFDCAAKQGGISLNSQCFRGPDLNNKLLHVLLRFRQFEFAIMADIEAMYLQVKIPEKDRNCLRFLWQDGDSISEYRMTSHLFGGVWCASSSTFALRRVVQDVSSSDLVCDTVNRAFYVDDMLKSVSSLDEAVEVISGTRAALMSGGFNLTKFVVNDSRLLPFIAEEDRAKEVKEITAEAFSKALGIHWDVADDSFFYVSRCCESSSVVTKRVMLKQVSSMYDPLGLISPIVMQGKMLFQEVTRLKKGWDDSVSSSSICHMWSSWLCSLVSLPGLRFSRCIIPNRFVDGAAELHIFCDACEKGYGACCYIRSINQEGEVNVAFLASKGRLAPLKQCTIPRLELMAAVEGAKLDEVIRRELDVSLLSSVFWTDSRIVLSYIWNDSKRFQVFVGNRVSFIRERCSPEQWRHVEGKSNPADVLSRGCMGDALPPIWFQGPTFLHDYKSEWPNQEKLQVPDDDPEVKKNVISAVTEVNRAESCQFEHPIEKMMKHYSSFYKLKKAISWLIRIKSHLQKKSTGLKGAVSVLEQKAAEKMVIKFVQHQAYNTEVEALSQGKDMLRSSSIKSLSPGLQDELLVVGGRLKNSSLGGQAKNPIILPHDHRLSLLIVQEYHGAAHLGVEWLLSLIRRKFWITRCRSIIKQVRRSCIVCKKMFDKVMVQRMADLPPGRCKPSTAPFTHVGVDLFGHFYVKQGRAEVKRYGCVYTCFTTRAIHIELLSSLETDTFINGFIRFIARRGQPETILSDNGTNLVGAHTELSRSLRQLDRNKVIQAARRRNIHWEFNPPYASHQGGVWERMIRTIRKVLVALLQGNSRMTDDVLHTIFCEVECIVNSRPLTKCSDDINDDAPLTPNHLLLLRGNSSLSWGVIQDGETYRRRWRLAQQIASQFWRRWLREYLPELQRRQKWHKKLPNIQVGDLVLIADENSPRGNWPLGLVVDTKEGRDGLVRSARLKTKISEVVRPISKIIHLEEKCLSDD